MCREVRGLISTNRQLQNGHGDVRYSIGNGVGKELVCMTHGHEMVWGLYEAVGGAEWRGPKGENWDNCNSIINKI